MHWSGKLKDGFGSLGALKAFLTDSTTNPASADAAKPLSSDSFLSRAANGAAQTHSQSSSVIKTVSTSASRKAKPATTVPQEGAAAAKAKFKPVLRRAPAWRSHASASLVMAVFVAGSGALSVLPGMPDAQGLFSVHAHQRIKLGPPSQGSMIEASVGGNTQSLFLDALKPNVQDDLTQAQAMPETKIVSIRPGDTLSGLLVEAGASTEDARDAVTALKAHFDPRRIKAGQDIELTLGPPGNENGDNEDEGEGRRLVSFSVQTDLTTHVSVARNDDDDGYDAQVTQAVLTERPVRAVASIDSSLFIAAADAGIPDSITVDLIRLYSYDIDFEREIQKGDNFEVFYTQMVNEKGQVVQNGRILYAGLTTGGRTHKLWRYAAQDDSVADYYDESGHNAKKALMRTPVDGARLTSGFGMRRHPILGYSKMHKGVDFGAPIGTPVMAAGSGTVEYASPFSTYGNYVRIRHTNGYKTAYAHLRGFAKGIKPGAHVTQGQIIAFVGMTGRSTGPHLHYEVLVADHQVNPMGIKVATGQQLEGKDLKTFQAQRASIETEMANATQLGRSTQASIAPAVSDTIRR